MIGLLVDFVIHVAQCLFYILQEIEYLLGGDHEDKVFLEFTFAILIQFLHIVHFVGSGEVFHKLLPVGNRLPIVATQIGLLHALLDDFFEC